MFLELFNNVKTNILTNNKLFFDQFIRINFNLYIIYSKKANIGIFYICSSLEAPVGLPRTGIEPARPKRPLAPQASVSTNSTTWALI